MTATELAAAREVRRFRAGWSAAIGVAVVSALLLASTAATRLECQDRENGVRVEFEDPDFEDPEPEDPGRDEEFIEPLFNWDLVSLEQNNPRFNGSVLTGFHGVRSPGVTPLGALKVGVGLLYSREEQFAERVSDNGSLFRRNQIFLTPKVNFGFWKDLEAGLGVALSFVEGRSLVDLGGGSFETREERETRPSSVDLGLKWNFLDQNRWRLAVAFDARVAASPDAFGMLPGTFYNIELDGDFAVTRRLSLAGNLQFLTSDATEVRDQFIVDLAGQYSFTDTFRGMLFTTLQEDDQAGTVLGFIGFAGQWVKEQHSMTLSLDFQLNDASRELRTEEQLDISLSYAFTF